LGSVYGGILGIFGFVGSNGENYDILVLSNNPTIAQINKKKDKESKGKSLHIDHSSKYKKVLTLYFK
jgi:hypothetical protein